MRKYADRATGGESQAVCRVTATRMQNQTRSIPISLTRGMRMGTKIRTIGTHSNGHPRMKMKISWKAIVSKNMTRTTTRTMKRNLTRMRIWSYLKAMMR